MATKRLHPDWRRVSEGTLFNRFTMEVRGLSERERTTIDQVQYDEPIADSETYARLADEDILTDEDDPDSLLEEFERTAQRTDDITLNRIRFYVTERCNMGCPGCYVRFKYRNDEDFDNSDATKARKVVDFLREENRGDSFDIHFLGGEPLIGFELMQEAIEYAEEVCEETEPTFSVTTNATIVTDEIAEYLNEHDVTVGVSFDGWKEINDASRMYMSDAGTYDDAVEGYWTLKEHVENGVGILVTPQPLNIDVLDDVVEHLLAELDPDGLTVNDPFHSDGEWEVDGLKFAEKLKRILVLAGQYQTPLISPASKIIRAIAHERPKLQTMPTSERNMTAALSTDGRITYHIMNFDEELFPNPIDDRSEERFEKWATFSGYQHERCRDCVALNTCSGPDPIESYQGNGDIDDIQLNNERCKFYKEMTPWLVERIAAMAEKEESAGDDAEATRTEAD